MATIKHARTLALQATSPRINPVPLPTNVTVGTDNLTTGAVTGTKIGVGAVGTGNLGDGAVTAVKITDATITTAKIADGSITNAKIGALAVDTANIASAAITNAKIGTAAIATANIADAAITNAKIGTAAIATANIADAAITNAKIGALAVDAAKIAAATITTAKIANAAITTALIADANITNAKIGAAAVDTANIVNGSITNAKIGALAVDAAKIADATITTAKIADAQITSAKIASATITDANIASLNASKINAGTISANYINGGTFSGANIQIASSESGWLLNAGNNGTVVYYRRMEGYNLYATNGAMPGYSPITGASATAAAGVYGTSSNSGGHGVRGEAGNGLGFVGYNGGTYDFYAYGSASNYGPFTGAHDALIDKRVTVQAGDIVCDLGVAVRKNVSNTICFVAPSTAAAQGAAVGVVCTLPAPLDLADELPAAMMDRMWTTQPDGQRIENLIPCREWLDLRLTHNKLTINALGEGQVNVCGLGGNLQPGDLITTSPLPGKGQRQSDDVVRASSVAKCREAVTFDYPEQVRLVACIYLCG